MSAISLPSLSVAPGTPVPGRHLFSAHDAAPARKSELGVDSHLPDPSLISLQVKFPTNPHIFHILAANMSVHLVCFGIYMWATIYPSLIVIFSCLQRVPHPIGEFFPSWNRSAPL